MTKAKKVPKKFWVAPYVEPGYLPFFFTEKPELIKRDGKLFVYDFSQAKEVEIQWLRMYALKRNR